MTEGSAALTYFRVGRGIALVSGTTVALLDEKNGELADRLWSVLQHSGGADVLLEELSATGLRSLGAFAIAEREEHGVRFVVRGRGTVFVGNVDGWAEIDAGDTRTWTEVIVDDAVEFVLRISDRSTSDDTPFRLSEGLVPADLVAWGRSASEQSLLDGHDFTWVDRFEPVTVTGGRESLLGLDAPTPKSDGPIDADPVVPAEIEVASADIAPPDFGWGAPIDVSDIVDSVDTILPGDLGSRDPVGGAQESSGSDVSADLDIDGSEYDALFGETTFKSVHRAAVSLDEEGVPRAAIDPAPEPPSEGLASGGTMISAVPPGVSGDTFLVAPDDAGDHDGHTVSITHLRALRGAADGGISAIPQPVMGGATVQASMCAAGHPNPPQAVTCRTCGVAVAGTSVVIGRPRLGRLVLSDGQVVELDRPAVLGRRPKVGGVLHGEVPQLVVIGDAQGLSRSHAMVRLEQWQVLVEDLGSANGTFVTLPGREPRRLHERDPMLLEHDAIIDLGGDITIRVDLRS